MHHACGMILIWKSVSEKTDSMATLAMFYGIIVKMNKEDREPHHKAHVHALHAGKTASKGRISRLSR